MSIQLENGRINLEGLDGIADHLKALTITNKTIDSLKLKVESCNVNDADRYRRVNDAYKAWSKMRRRINERLAIMRREEKELNRRRTQFENEELLKLLRQQVSKSDLSVCRAIAQSLAEERLQSELSKAGNAND